MTTASITFPRVPLKSMDPSMLVFELDCETHRLMPDDTTTAMITSAATMASFLHRRQTRFVRGDMERVPYIEHPLRVALRLVRWGVRDPELIAAGLLHDVAEDCADELLSVFGRSDENAQDCLGRLYGHRVAELVGQVTNPVACGSKNAATRKSYQEHIKMLAASDSVAVLIKASDLKDNAGSIAYQLGHGKDEKMLRMLRKYLPAVEVMSEGMAATVAKTPWKTTNGFRTAALQMRSLLRDLQNLAAEYGIEH